jgi:amino acid transporter
MVKASSALKRVVVGRPMSSGELEHTLLPKVIALPVFASDPLSSNAYATQEAMIVLAGAGAVGLSFILPVSIAVACVLAIVVSSYRQTVYAYPAGGGAYRVARENLGLYPGILAASALLGDYVLTVAVSVTAGTEAVVSAAPSLDDLKVPIALSFIVLVTLANLRGAKESGVIFAIPTYGFVLSVYLLLATGIARCLDACPQAASAGHALPVTQALSAALILRAFAAGTTALTGVEAIADGTAAFRYPQSKNAATTLTVMGALAISMFLGISWLADHTNVVYHQDDPQTVVAQIAHAVFRGGLLFYFLQVMTAAILVLAANTAYQDFPRLSSILAGDRLMPRQFQNRGDRLVFSNGILILSVLASLLVYTFKAELTHLIQLYLIGVFISFTLSQTGLVVRFRRLKQPGWQRKTALSGFGAVVTGIVLIVIAYTKFARGAWIIMACIPVVMYLMRSVHSHYQDVTQQLRDERRRPRDRRPSNQHVVILVTKVDVAVDRAIGYTRAIRAADAVAVTLDPANREAWARHCTEIDLEVLRANGSLLASLQMYLRGRRADLGPDDFLTVIVPEVLRERSLLEILFHPRLHRLKAALLREPGVQVLDVPIVEDKTDAKVLQTTDEPSRNYVCVMVSGVHNATLQAIEYAETLRPTDIRAVSFGLVPEDVEKLGDKWLEARIPVPLEIEASPFRDIGTSLVRYIRPFRADGIHRVVTVVIPEFVVSKRRHNFLHGQTALVVKRHLLFEPGVVVVSVPYHLSNEASTVSAPT